MDDEILKIKERRYRGETEVVSARLPSELVKELNFIAKETGRSRNEVIETCLTFAVRRVKIEKDD
ncbi:MAG: ribbon-helix-helix protein, CopG family [Oscillospiraceae bacterium]|nr:ribbon-helix-helix protein, CopG family [Oscillospiraceae bacterium]